MSARRPTIAYVLTSSGNDYHSTMARVSARSVRLSNPGCRILVACDPATAHGLAAADDPLLREIDELRTVDCAETDRLRANRSVKLRLRQCVAGDFLMLDADVLVRGPLDTVFAVDGEIAGARNHSHPDAARQIAARDQRILRTMGWEPRTDGYVNGGLLLLRDTRAVHTFSADWYDLWCRSSERCGDHRDQPSLNAALRATSASVTLLEDRFNYQFLARPGAAREATVWHYYSSRSKQPITGFECLVERVLDGAALLDDDVRTLAARRDPWLCEGRVDRYVADRIARRGTLSRFDKCWLRRQPVRAALAWLLRC